MDIVTKTFLFNIMCIVIFSLIYMYISPDNFAALQTKDKITYIDLIFYSTTIQSGVGLSDINAVTDLAKILSIIQQLIMLASVFILIKVFYNKK
jgi:hypothetical protein